MLKVNLKNTKVQSSKTESSISAQTGTAFGSSYTGSLSATIEGIKRGNFLQDLEPAVLLKFVVKALLILCFPFALKIYEAQQIDSLKAQKTALEGNLAEQTKARDILAKKIKSFDYLTIQAKEYDQKKETLRKLARSRLIIPQLLDQIQSIIPESVWLKTLSVKIKGKGGLSIQGESLSEDRINLFADSLKNIVDRDSISLSTRDVRSQENFVKVSFDLKADLLKERSL